MGANNYIPIQRCSRNPQLLLPSCAKAKVAFDAISRNDGDSPRMVKNLSSNTWKKGGVVDVGLNN